MARACPLEHPQLAAHGEAEELGGHGLAGGPRNVRRLQQVHALRRQVLGDDRRPALAVAPPSRSGDHGDECPDQPEQRPGEADAGERVGREGVVPRDEGAGPEADDHGQALVGAEVARPDVDPPSGALGGAGERVAAPRGAGGTLEARRVPGEPLDQPGCHVQGGRNRAERLIPPGSVGLPVELLVGAAAREQGHVVLAVADHVSVCAVHEVIGRDGDVEELAVVALVGLVAKRCAVPIGHARDGDVGRVAGVVRRDGAEDAVVLVEIGEPGDEGLGRGQG